MLSSSEITATAPAHFIDALFQDTFLFVMEVLHDTRLVRDEVFYRRGYELVAQVKSALETLNESDEFKMQVMYAQCGLLDYTVLNSALADENTVWRRAPLEGAHLATLRAGEINPENLRQPVPELPLSSPVIDEFVRQQGTEISSGGNTAIIAERDVNSETVRVTASGDIGVAAGRDVNLTTATESDYHYKELTKTKKWFLSKKTTHTSKRTAPPVMRRLC